MITKAVVIGLRGLSIGARFCLSFVFVKNFSLSFQGEYSLLVTSVTLAMLIIGFDFYVFSNRFIIQNKNLVEKAISNQFVTQLILYGMLLVIFLIAKTFFESSLYFELSFFFLLFFEHIGMELFRLLIALEKPLFANIVLFLRTGTWPIYLIYLIVINQEIISLDTIINSWLVASVLAVLASGWLLMRVVKITKFHFDIKWIFKGYGVAAFFLVSTLAQKGIEFSDRYIISAFKGSEELGAYSFYFQLANVATVAIFTLLFSFKYPSILATIEEKNWQTLKTVISKLETQILVFMLSYSILIFIALPSILEMVGKPRLSDQWYLLIFFLLGNLFFNLSFTSHYALMGLHKDKELMWISIFISIFNIACNILAVFLFGILGAVVVFFFSATLLFLFKRNRKRYYLKLMEND